MAMALDIPGSGTWLFWGVDVGCSEKGAESAVSASCELL